ncbi:MAG: BrnT family toxin [Patescibacteria group bacterium]
MKVKDQEVAFEWDKGNSDKSSRKHGVTPEESESVFLDEEAFIFPDVRHSETEDRFVILGISDKGRYLFVIFTIRNEYIRIISARRMHQKELDKYDKVKKSTKI